MKKLNVNKSDILTIAGSVGVVATAISAGKASSKAERIKKENDFKDKKDKMRFVLPCYIPTVLLGTATISCIFGINMLGRKEQATLLSAYSLLDSSFKEYRAKVDEIFGEGADSDIKEAISVDHVEGVNELLKKVKLEGEEKLFFDMTSGQYFPATLDKVIQAEKDFEAMLSVNRRGSVNEFYELLEIEESPFPWSYGWCETINGLDPIFTHHEVTLDDGLECTIICMDNEPEMLYA